VSPVTGTDVVGGAGSEGLSETSGTITWLVGEFIQDPTGTILSAAQDMEDTATVLGLVLSVLLGEEGLPETRDVSITGEGIDEASAPSGVSPAVAREQERGPEQGWFLRLFPENGFFGMLPHTGLTILVLMAASLVLIAQGTGMVALGRSRRRTSQVDRPLS
jgi:hypothetical protein